MIRVGVEVPDNWRDFVSSSCAMGSGDLGGCLRRMVFGELGRGRNSFLEYVMNTTAP